MTVSDFRIIRPLTVTNAILTSCTVPEVTVTAYSGATTYALADIRGVGGANNSQVVYESLQASNLNHTPASSPTWWKNRGTVYGTYAGGTTYALADIVTDATNHLLYESIQASNTGHALTDIAWWTPLGNTNRHKQFDTAVNSQTVAPYSISQVFTPGELTNTVTLLNAEGATATVTQSVSGYSEVKSLIKHEVLTWYDFYYEEPVRVGDVAFTDIPPYPASTLTVTVDNGTGEAAIGCCLLGKSRTIGTTLFNFSGGVLSYSTTTTSAQGNTTMVRRPNAKRLQFEVFVAEGFQSEAYRLLTLYTDVEMVFIGASEYSMGIAYGFLDQWDVYVTDTAKPASISIRGLI